jgi:hypothetical protein
LNKQLWTADRGGALQLGGWAERLTTLPTIKNLLLNVLLRERDHLKDRGVDGRMRSKCILGRSARGVRGRFTWLRIRTDGGLL